MVEGGGGLNGEDKKEGKAFTSVSRCIREGQDIVTYEFILTGTPAMLQHTHIHTHTLKHIYTTYTLYLTHAFRYTHTHMPVLSLRP